MKDLKTQIKEFPKTPGVYLFKNKQGVVLYVGKATNLRSRVSSYLTGNDSRGERILNLVKDSIKVEYKNTDSVLEALILESILIKKYFPKYNIDGKDNKSFAYFVITKEEFPRVLIWRERELKEKVKKIPISHSFGPYLSKGHMQIALKIIRRIFPFHALKQKSEKGCLDFQMGKCPGPYNDSISKKDYLNNIKGIRYVLEGKKKRLITDLEKRMLKVSKDLNFEQAEIYKRQIFALNHIRDIALLTADAENNLSGAQELQERIECYDISNISGEYCVGSMVVFVNGKANKGQYRRFKIKNVNGINDVAAMAEVLERRLKHDEWPLPDLILIDGGRGHLNKINKILEKMKLHIPAVGVAKGPKRDKLDIHGKSKIKDKKVLAWLENEMLLRQLRDEAHRFAIEYHRKLRGDGFLKK